MRKRHLGILAILLAATLFPLSAYAEPQCVAQAGLPDPTCTPGAVDASVTQDNIMVTICSRGYSTHVRPPVSITEPLKRQDMMLYGLQNQQLRAVELDHLVPLEVGGAPADPNNLWPEFWEDQPDGPGAHTKDKVENAAHAAVCRGELTLADAQQGFETNWQALGEQLGVLP
jgi:hypothetical protein